MSDALSERLLARTNAPRPMGRRRRLDWQVRSHTAALRVKPDFLIIGAAKAGSTSLYNYITMHPDIFEAFRKEVHYFDHCFERGDIWYRAHFPLKAEMAAAKLVGRSAITGEATPYYIFHPCGPKRVHEFNPGMKLLAILRNPIDRAYSHHQQNVNRHIEDLPFEEAIAVENDRIAGEAEKLLNGDISVSPSYQHHSYLARGFYFDQIQAWLKYFPREQMHVLFTEELKCTPGDVVSEAVRFLGVRDVNLERVREDHAGVYKSSLAEETRARLEEFYREPNRQLSEFLGRGLPW